jgi:uncharacterized protein (DUF2236 family)
VTGKRAPGQRAEGGRGAGEFGVDEEGLFGPQSLTWRVHADPVLWVGGVRALFLQALHPAAMAGVLEHSDFRRDPWGRLIRTARYVGTVSYGRGEQVRAAAARVRGLHAKASGVDPVTGVTYRADDPELLIWVHCCEVDSFLTAYRRSGADLTAGEADRYLAEQTRAAAVLGVDPDRVPASCAALADYFDRIRPQLSADRRTRRLAGYLLVPPMPFAVAAFTPARPAWAGVVALAYGLLPRWARRLYGTPGLPWTDPATTAALHLWAGLVRQLPAGLTEGPHLRSARRRAGLPAGRP